MVNRFRQCWFHGVQYVMACFIFYVVYPLGCGFLWVRLQWWRWKAWRGYRPVIPQVEDDWLSVCTTLYPRLLEWPMEAFLFRCLRRLQIESAKVRLLSPVYLDAALPLLSFVLPTTELDGTLKRAQLTWLRDSVERLFEHTTLFEPLCKVVAEYLHGDAACPVFKPVALWRCERELFDALTALPFLNAWPLVVSPACHPRLADYVTLRSGLWLGLCSQVLHHGSLSYYTSRVLVELQQAQRDLVSAEVVAKVERVVTAWHDKQRETLSLHQTFDQALEQTWSEEPWRLSSFKSRRECERKYT